MLNLTLIVGCVFAALCGLTNSLAAALQKREGRTVEHSKQGISLLLVLVRRPRWLATIVLSVLAWAFDAVALGSAPVPAVTTIRSAGRIPLVPVGVRWFGERFSRTELSGVMLALVGAALTAVSAGHATQVVHTPLAVWEQVLIGVGILVVAWLVARLRSGIANAAASGVAFVGTGVFTKEIGDRFFTHGFGAIEATLASPGLWFMVVLGIAGQAYLQNSLRLANVASATVTSTGISTNGLVLFNYLIYRAPFPGGLLGVGIVAGLVCATAGTYLMARSPALSPVALAPGLAPGRLGSPDGSGSPAASNANGDQDGASESLPGRGRKRASRLGATGEGKKASGSP